MYFFKIEISESEGVAAHLRPSLAEHITNYKNNAKFIFHSYKSH